MTRTKNEELKLDDSVKQNSKGQVILGQLYGPCADFLNPTRNGRMYDESLWEKVFNNPIVQEYFECGGIPGELDHPTDRLETCSEKIAIMMPDKPKKDKDGHLIATFDILDTPNGRIAYTLAKYGYKLGISSRGGGDTYEGMDGKEHVNEDTYDFQGFDLVLLPAVKAARLKMVESLQNGKSFKAAINEALQNANADEKKVMQETLQNLNIEYTHESDIDKKVEENDIAANDAGAMMVKDLQESLLKQQQAEAKVLELQEKLSVCYAKEAKYEEDIAKYKQAIRNLSESASNAKALQVKIDNLNEELMKKDKLIESESAKREKLLERQEMSIDARNKLTESISAKAKELKVAEGTISDLNEKLEQSNQKNQSLTESIAEVKKNLTIKTNEYNSKLSNANKLVEQYRKTAKTAVNKYIESRATMIGVTCDEIKNKLPSNYSFEDIDRICESLSKYKLQVSKLPFSVQKDTKISIKESKEPIKPKSTFDDSVDDSLMKLAGLN